MFTIFREYGKRQTYTVNLQKMNKRNYEAKKALDYIIGIKKDNELFLVLSGHIGDVIYGLAFLEAIESHTGKVVSIICSSQRNLLLKYYKINGRVINDDKININGMLYLCQSNKVSLRGAKLGIYNTNSWFYIACKYSFFKTNALSFQRKLFNLNRRPIITQPSVTFKSNFCEHFESIDYRKMVIINPFSTSLNNAKDFKFFNNASRLLAGLGFDVYTNTFGKEKPLPKTKPLDCTLEELYYITTKIPLIISIRSGILDFIINTGINMFVIYYKCPRRFYNVYRLHAWPKKGIVKEVFIRHYSYKSLQKKLVNFIKGICNF